MLTRRQLLGGLLVAVSTGGKLLADGGPGKAAGPAKLDDKQPLAGLAPNLFVHVGSDGSVTIACHRSEMGQGVRSTLPVLLADELGADPAMVRIVQGDNDTRYGDQNTDGSSSIRSHYGELRKAAATARTMLIAAAATRLRLPASSLTTRDGAVWHGATSIPFGALADAAGRLPVPPPASVTLRPDGELRHVFRDLPDVDARAIATGSAQYGADVRLDGMLIAVIARPPAVGDRPKRVDGARALAVPGVRRVVPLPQPSAPWKFQPWGGVAVVAEDTWAALRGRAALDVEWEPGPHAKGSSDEQEVAMQNAVWRHLGDLIRDRGDAETAIAKAARTVEATYHTPHLAHAPMEPPAALAHVTARGCELWLPTQNPQVAAHEVAKLLGLSDDKVTCHVTLLGGAFGRKSKADFACEAAWLSRELAAPVRVQWTREDDLRHDYYNATNTTRVTAALDGHGDVTAVRLRTAFTPIASTFSGAEQPSASDLQQGVTDLPIAVPNVRAVACPAAAQVRVGWLRSVYNIFHAFAWGSFVDELARARGVDPLQQLLALVGPPRLVTLDELGIDKLSNYGASLEQHPIDTGRLRAVTMRAVAMSGWATRADAGRTLGIAAHRSFLTYVAVVASVVPAPNGRPAVDEVWLAYDAGLVVNTERARSQMEGAVLFGMSHALYGGVTVKRGAIVESNFHDHPLVRIGEAPRRIHVERVVSDGPPGGIGEPGVPPVAPAIANAIFARTGERVRRLGFFRDGNAPFGRPSGRFIPDEL